MMGRIDLVTPMHRRTLEKLAQSSGDPSKKDVIELYRQLGRFAGAIVRDEAKQHPSKQLQVLAGIGS
jgi:hypothetical protein